MTENVMLDKNLPELEAFALTILTIKFIQTPLSYVANKARHGMYAKVNYLCKVVLTVSILGSARKHLTLVRKTVYL